MERDETRHRDNEDESARSDQTAQAERIAPAHRCTVIALDDWRIWKGLPPPRPRPRRTVAIKF